MVAENNPSVLRDAALGIRDMVCRRKISRDAAEITCAAGDDDDRSLLAVERSSVLCKGASGVEPLHLSPAQKQDARINARNLLLLVFGMSPALTALFGLQMLESSINSSHGLGQGCLALVYGVSVLSVTFLSPVLLRRLGPPWVLRLCLVPLSLFVAAHFKIVAPAFLSSCALEGLANNMFMTAASVVATTTALDYASIYRVPRDAIMTRVNSVMFTGLVLNYFIGPMILSLVVHSPDDRHGNSTAVTQRVCNDSEQKLVVAEFDRNVLLSVFLALIVLGFFILSLMKSPSETSVRAKLAKSTAGEQITATVRLLGDFDMLLLIPVLFFSGMTKEMISANFTEFYIAPCFGVGHVGYGIAAFGAANTVTTAVLPLVLKLSGRPVVVAIASCMELSVMLTLVLWTRSRNAVLLYALAAMWGSADGIWNIIMSVMTGLIFSQRQEAAFSNYRVWQGIGFAAGAIYSQRIGRCKEQLQTKLIFLSSLLLLAACTYSVLECRLQKSLKMKNIKEASDHVNVDTVELLSVTHTTVRHVPGVNGSKTK